MDEPGGRGKGAEAGETWGKHQFHGREKMKLLRIYYSKKIWKPGLSLKIDDADRPVRIGLKSELAHVGS